MTTGFVCHTRSSLSRSIHHSSPDNTLTTYSNRTDVVRKKRARIDDDDDDDDDDGDSRPIKTVEEEKSFTVVVPLIKPKIDSILVSDLAKRHRRVPCAWFTSSCDCEMCTRTNEKKNMVATCLRRRLSSSTPRVGMEEKKNAQKGDEPCLVVLVSRFLTFLRNNRLPQQPECAEFLLAEFRDIYSSLVLLTDLLRMWYTYVNPDLLLHTRPRRKNNSTDLPVSQLERRRKVPTWTITTAADLLSSIYSHTPLPFPLAQVIVVEYLCEPSTREIPIPSVWHTIPRESSSTHISMSFSPILHWFDRSRSTMLVLDQAVRTRSFFI